MLRVKDILTESVEIVHADLKVDAVLKLMKMKSLGVVLVRDKHRLSGIVSTSRMLRHPEIDKTSLRRVPARAIMDTNLHFCYADQPLEDAQVLMRQKDLKYLVVLNRDKRLEGLLNRKQFRLSEFWQNPVEK